MKPSDKDNKLRLQVFLSRNGVCSRRAAMKIVQDGKVKVNGEVVVEPSTPIDGHRDQVTVDGKPVVEQKYMYVMFNKPVGCVTTKVNQYAQKTIFDILPKKYSHLVPVGRLDKNTEGLLLLTNDGETVYKLTHPKFNIDKTYLVRVQGVLSMREKRKLENGVVVEGKMTAPAKIKNQRSIGENTEISMTIHEGRKRQIRLMLAKVGHKVIFLRRLAQGGLELGSLVLGTCRELASEEVGLIRKL